MKLLVIRHGQSEADIRRVCEGRADFPLTGQGLDQARRIARWLNDQARPSRIYSSPLLRARQTAEAIAQVCGGTVTELADLMEFDNGELAGVPFSQVAQRFPVVPDVPAHAAVYGQETRLAFRLRAESVLSRVLHENPEDATICLVTHGGMINQLLRAFLRLPVDANYWVVSDDGAIHEWVILGESRGIARLNSREHLADGR